MSTTGDSTVASADPILASEPRAIPPLLGDGQGHYRVHILGNSGVGKVRSKKSINGPLCILGPQTTAGKELAAILGVQFIGVDRLLFDPGWVEAKGDKFQQRLRAALDAAPNGWVLDGKNTNSGGAVAFEEATDIIWLDPPLYAYFPRLFWRTMMRMLRLAPPCSPGCYESPWNVFFSRESLLRWCIESHWTVRERNYGHMARIGIENGIDVGRRRMRRFGGWGGEIKAWLGDVAAMMRGKND